MDLLQGLTNILGQGMGGAPGGQSGAGDAGGLGALLNPEVLGGLMSSLFAGKSSGGPGATSNMGAAGGMGGLGGLGALGGLLGSLMGGGGESAPGGAGGMGGMGGLGELFGGKSAPVQAKTPAPANSSARAERMVRAIVYAAKADGHIDDQEQAAIDAQMQKLNLGPEGQRLVRQAVAEPLDPSRIADGVQDQQEAAQLYIVSRVLTNADQFMEKSYLEALAKALGIPPEAQNAVERRIASHS